MAITKLASSGVVNTKSDSLLVGNANRAPAFDSINTITVGSSSMTTIDFQNIPNVYQHLQIRGISKTASTGDNLRVRFNNDSSSSYSSHIYYGNGTTSAATDSGGVITIGWCGNSTYSGTQANTFSGFIIDVLDYKETTKYKTLRFFSGYDLNGSGEVRLGSSLWKSTNSINQITFYNGSGTGDFQQYTHFALYGIR